MITYKLLGLIKKTKAIFWFPALSIIFLFIALYYHLEGKNNRTSFPYSLACRGDFLSEVLYDNKRVKMNTMMYFSFLNKSRLLVSMSGNVYLYDINNKLIDRKIILRNIYYDYTLENKALQTYTLKSSQVNIDSVDTMNEELSRLVLMNSSYIVGDTDTLVLKKYDAHTLLIETNQSPFLMCVFKNAG